MQVLTYFRYNRIVRAWAYIFSAMIGAAIMLTGCASQPFSTSIPPQAQRPQGPLGPIQAVNQAQGRIGPVAQTQGGQVQGRPGVYTPPQHLQPVAVPRLPPIDACRSQFYQGLIGQHEGAIYIAGLPGRKRVLKPAFLESFDREPVIGIDPKPPLIEVRDYIPDQVLYAPSIRTVSDLLQLGPAVEERLTIELDRQGYVQQIRCG